MKMLERRGMVGNGGGSEIDYDGVVIIAVGDGSFSLLGNGNSNLFYSFDGKTWKNDRDYHALKDGQQVALKGYVFANGAWNNNNVISCSPFNIKGNILSLLDGDNYHTIKSTPYQRALRCAFYHMSVIDASGLILPYIAGTSVYQSAFESCIVLTKSPILYGGSASNYIQLFSGCSGLTEITYLGNSAPDFDSWVTNVPSGGVFYKSKDATWVDSFGNNAIPNGWGVELI